MGLYPRLAIPLIYLELVLSKFFFNQLYKNDLKNFDSDNQDLECISYNKLDIKEVFGIPVKEINLCFINNKLYSIYDLIGVDSHGDHAHDITMEQVETAFFVKEDFGLKMSDKTIVSKESAAAYFNNSELVFGANLIKNEYGHQLFANFFYFITGFHGFHVFSGVMILVIIFINVIKGTYEKRGHYEMVEKVGLYWHFVDLVWVFVFTFFYLV